ncbi:MAG: F0F1 ATP synthase subunit B [Mangrovicoccus sp.]|nr:F0F1 ATP synthase subunit B [Mangrovicoccus sp.]
MTMLRIAVLAAFAATPALAAGDVFFSLANTDFIVLLAFLLFIAVLFYFKVPSLIGGMLDKRAEGIASELEEARALREEAQTLLASYEKKKKEVQEQAETIVEAAKKEAESAAVEAKKELEASIARRLAAADEQIAQAEAKAVKQVQDQAASVAVAAAGDVISGAMSAEKAGSLIDSAIAEVGQKLH